MKTVYENILSELKQLQKQISIQLNYNKLTQISSTEPVILFFNTMQSWLPILAFEPAELQHLRGRRIFQSYLLFLSEKC